MHKGKQMKNTTIHRTIITIITTAVLTTNLMAQNVVPKWKTELKSVTKQLRDTYVSNKRMCKICVHKASQSYKRLQKQPIKNRKDLKQLDNYLNQLIVFCEIKSKGEN